MTPSSNIAWRRSFANVRIVADRFGDDVARPFERLCHAGDAFFRIDKGSRERLQRHAGRCLIPRLLFPKIGRQWVQAFFPCDGRFGAALRFVRQVEIFQFALIERLFDPRSERVGELALFLDGVKDGLLARNQLAEIEKLLFNGANLKLVQVAGHLLPVARDERNRGAFVKKLTRSEQALHRDLQRLSNVDQEIGRKGLDL